MQSAILSLSLIFCLARAGAAEVDARDWQLFIDDHAIARATGFDRVVHHPRPMGVVIANDKPWESGGVAPEYFARRADGTFVGFYEAIWWAPHTDARSSTIDEVVYSGGAWRRRNPDNRPPDLPQQYVSATGYATSRDGIHWDKPALGLAGAPSGTDWGKFPPFPSPTGCTTENNLGVPFRIADLGQYGNLSDPARRYAVYTGGRAYFAAAIPDFIHDRGWRSKLVDAGGIFSPRAHALHFWDPQHREWVAMVQNAVPHWLPSREIARFASTDLREWRSEIALAPDTADPHTPGRYDEPMDLYPFCSEGIVFGLLSWIHTDRTTPDGGPVMERRPGVAKGWPWPITAENPYVWPWARKGTNEMRIAISRDGGRSWDRASSREAWIPHGAEEDSYDRLVLSAAPPVRVGDEDWFYLGVWDGDHLTNRANAAQTPYYHDRIRKGQIALYIQKRDRYVSLRTGSQVETLITKPFRVEGGALELNVDASRGKVRVGIAEYKPVATLRGAALSTAPHLMEQNMLPGYSLEDCRPIGADGTAHVVEFKNGPGLESIRGRSVVLFVEMQDADLYGFRVR